MKKYRPFITGIIVGVALLVVIVLITGGKILLPDRAEYFEGLDEAYGKYYEIIKIIDEEALADYNPEQITDSVLKKMVAGLDDKYAVYYTAEEYEAFIKRYAEAYVGVGISVTEEDGKILVVDVIEDGPAAEADVRQGDYISFVDGKKVKDSDDVAMKLSGKNGTEVTITVERDGKNIDIRMNRGKVAVKSVEYKMLDEKNKIGYINIASFKEGTAKEFRLAVKDLKNDGYYKVVIDLRNNGGGSTREAYKVADYLLPECRMLTEVNSRKEEKVRESGASTLGIKYVLLVNENTASASEMISASVKDNNGGKLIGCRTFGKGVSQKTTVFDDGSALKITIEEFFGPNGDAINEVGIEPDILADNADDDKEVLSLAKKILIRDKEEEIRE